MTDELTCNNCVFGPCSDSDPTVCFDNIKSILQSLKEKSKRNEELKRKLYAKTRVNDDKRNTISQMKKVIEELKEKITDLRDEVTEKEEAVGLWFKRHSDVEKQLEKAKDGEDRWKSIAEGRDKVVDKLEWEKKEWEEEAETLRGEAKNLADMNEALEEREEKLEHRFREMIFNGDWHRRACLLMDEKEKLEQEKKALEEALDVADSKIVEVLEPKLREQAEKIEALFKMCVGMPHLDCRTCKYGPECYKVKGLPPEPSWPKSPAPPREAEEEIDLDKERLKKELQRIEQNKKKMQDRGEKSLEAFIEDNIKDGDMK